MHVYVWEHIASLYYRTTLWMFTKLGVDEVIMARHMHKNVLAQVRIKGEGGPLLQKTSSDRKATATNRIHTNDLEACVMKCCCFWFHSVV